MKIKVCGMKIPDNILEVAVLQPDYLGFIFYEKSPRFFEGGIPEINEKVKKTGVFVDASKEFILEKTFKHNLQAVQLHGRETPAFCAALKAEGVEIIKVFSVKEEFDFNELKAYEGKTDLFLFDTKGKAKGGNGISFNWKTLKNYPSETPFFLSGGIGPEDLRKLKEFQAYFEEKGKSALFYGIDLNSKFETIPGCKDFERLKKFKAAL